MLVARGGQVQQGALDDAAAWAQALAGCDAVLCCLGTHEKKRVRLMQAQLPRVIQAMRQSACQRLVLLSAFGVGASSALASVWMRLIDRTLVRDVYADKAAAEQALPDSGLRWTLVYPVILRDGPPEEAVGVYAQDTLARVNGLAQIPRAHVARAMLDGVDDARAWGQTLVLAPARAVRLRA